MDRPYVEWVRIENYRCIKQVDLKLTPLHALIGPNDSGKSSILRALRGQFPIDWWLTNGYWIAAESGQAHNGPLVANAFGKNRYPASQRSTLGEGDTLETIGAPLVGRALIRLDPDEIRQPCSLLPSDARLWFENERGRGLAGLYDALLTRDRDAFSRIDRRFAELFPTVRSLWLENVSSYEKALGLTLTNGMRVPAPSMSEGMLYWLAFAIIEYLEPQAMVFLEEPENGLHPARIAEVMKVLREVSKRTQIVLATHSPLVINELQPEEVTVVTRTAEHGTRCTPMTQTKNFASRSEVYALGELWLSFADGDLERDLVGDGPTDKAS